jgi:hypothetical protein
MFRQINRLSLSGKMYIHRMNLYPITAIITAQPMLNGNAKAPSKLI